MLIPAILPPTANAELLTDLARHPDVAVRALVAAHPNTPVGVLGQLGADHPHELLSNPALPLLRLAQPQQIARWSALTLAALAALPDAPGWVQTLAARHPSWAVQQAVLRGAVLGAPQLRLLAGSVFWQVRAQVAALPGLPADLLKQLANDRDYGVRRAVASRPDLLPGLRTALGQDPHSLMRVAATPPAQNGERA